MQRDNRSVSTLIVHNLTKNINMESMELSRIIFENLTCVYGRRFMDEEMTTILDKISEKISDAD